MLEEEEFPVGHLRQKLDIKNTRLVTMAHAVILTLGRWKQEDGVFKASLSYGRSLGLPERYKDPILKQTNKQQ